MIGFKIQAAKGLFFDRAKVTNATDKATRKVLSRFGAFVRQTARSSIRKRKHTSSPGQPPTNKTGLLKKFIFFGYSPESRSVVIGAALLNKSTAAQRILEHGDTVDGERRGKRVRMKYEARPYMQPAFVKEKSQLPSLWRNAVRR